MAAHERTPAPVRPRPEAAPDHIEHVTRQPGTPLDTATRDYVEPRFGFDFSDVRIHADAQAAQSARQLDALAYTIGNHIVLDPQDAPRHALLHELAHVVQQQHNRQAAGREHIDGEAEADHAAALVAAGDHAPRLRPVAVGVQRLPRVSPWRRAAEADPAEAAKDQPPAMDVWDKARVGKPEDAQTALQRKQRQSDHVTNQNTVYAVIDAIIKEGAAGGNLAPERKLLVNSVQWITAGRIDLIVLTPTHDSDTRAPDYGKAFFDASVVYPARGGICPESSITGSDELYYEKRAASGVARRHPRTGRPTIFLFPGSSDVATDIERLLVHEAQHVIDNSGDNAKIAERRRKTGAAPKGDVSPELIRYQSEFRAYWISGAEPAMLGGQQLSDPKFGSPSKPATNTSKVKHPLEGSPGVGNAFAPVTTSFKNEKQENIFWKLTTEGYGFDNMYAMWPSFRSAVDAFDQPYGDNLVNSLRIDEVLTVLGWCNPTMGRDRPEVAKLFQKVHALDATDRQFLNDAAASKEFWDRARAALAPAVFTEFETAAKATATP